MAFYGLRAAIGDRSLKPSTPLSEVARFRYVDLQRTLRQRGWNTPGRDCAPATGWLSALVALLTVASLWSQTGPGALLLGLLVFVAAMATLHLCVFTSTGPAARTLGELAREVTALNGAKLLRRGASFNRRVFWDRFLRVLADGTVRAPLVREAGFY